MKILLTGGSGLLGRELLKLNPDIICPVHKEMDIYSWIDVKDCIEKHSPDIIIHAAAMTDNRLVEKFPTEAICTNIIGTANIAMACLELNIRMVYISTDYVYQGDRGNYKETDPLMPFNFYSWTKLGGECSVKAVPNHLIIRTSFGANEFPYKQAFVDKWVSKDSVEVIAPMIYEASLSPLTGVLNLGTERKTIYDYAVKRNKDVIPVKIEDSNSFTPYDTSLNLQKWQDYKSSQSIAKPHTECRICGSKDLIKYLDLGLMPLANNLESTAVAAKNKERYPLQVMFCPTCSLSQLSVVIDPEKMFSHYVYRSGINQPYKEHCRNMAGELKEKYRLNSDSFHIDIAGNDGTLLKEFKSILNHKVLNIDPASNLVAIAESEGITSLADFWSKEVASKYPIQADLITATNVFAHIDNVREFIQTAKIALKKDGVLVLEFPYLINIIEGMEWDQTYFEHVSYMSVIPICKLCFELDMCVIEVSSQAIHGGSIRVKIVNDEKQRCPNDSAKTFYQNEELQEYNSIEKYSDWGAKVKETIQDFGTKLLELKKSGAKIGAFAASAKGATLLNCCGINTDILDWIADETPTKINMFQPGTGIPIVHKSQIMKDKPDYIVVLSWNFTEVIIKRVRDLGYTGKFIIPLPNFLITLWTSLSLLINPK